MAEKPKSGSGKKKAPKPKKGDGSRKLTPDEKKRIGHHPMGGGRLP
jgi:hypothetical protein